MNMIDINELGFFALTQQKRIANCIYGWGERLSGSVSSSLGPKNKQAVLHLSFLEKICTLVADSQNPEQMKQAIALHVEEIERMAHHMEHRGVVPRNEQSRWKQGWQVEGELESLLKQDKFFAQVLESYKQLEHLTNFLMKRSSTHMEPDATKEKKSRHTP